MSYKWQGYIDYAFANDIPLVDLMEKAYQMGRTDVKAEYGSADIPIIHGKAELELHDSGIRADERDRVRNILKDELESGYLLVKLLRKIYAND